MVLTTANNERSNKVFIKQLNTNTHLVHPFGLSSNYSSWNTVICTTLLVFGLIRIKELNSQLNANPNKNQENNINNSLLILHQFNKKG